MRRVRSTHETSVWLVAGAFAVIMLGTTLPTPLYALYQNDWGFSTLTGTIIFSAYALGVIAALLLLGRGSDVAGRKPMLFLGFACAAASDVAFLLANDVSLLLLGRLLSGVSAGIFTGTATATMVDLAPAAARDRATLKATVANMGGLALGPLAAGLLAHVAPEPLLFPYAVHLGLVALAAVVLGIVPETVDASGPLRLQPPRIGLPSEVSGIFLRVALPGFVGFAVLGLFAAVAPTFMRQLLGLSHPVLAGGVAAIVFVGSCLGQVTIVPPLGRYAFSAGRASLICGLGLLAIALRTESFTLLLIAAAVAGLGQGIAFRVGLTQLNEHAPEHHRAEVASSFFTVMYAGISIPVVAVGLGTHHWGLQAAGIGFCLTMAALVLTQVVLGRVFGPAAHSLVLRKQSEVFPCPDAH